MHNPEKFEQSKMEIQGEVEEKKPTPEDLYGTLRAEQEKLNDREIIHRYFEVESGLEPEYVEEIKSMSRKIGDLSPACELVIVIPAYREEKNIQRTLETLKRSISLKEGQYEIILVNNYPEGMVPDRTQKIAEGFKKEHKWENLHIIEKQFPKAIANVGSARKLGSDIALWRYKERLRNFPLKDAFYIAGTDADVMEVPKDHYPRMLEEFKNRRLDVIAGRPTTNIEKLVPLDFFKKRPNLYNLVEMRRALLSELKKVEPEAWDEFWVEGRDFALSASAYARIGGIPRWKVGEDVVIADRTFELDLKHDVLENSPLVVSPRREIIDWKGVLFSEVWHPERFMERSQEIRALEHLSTQELIESIPEITKKELKTYTEDILMGVADTLSWKQGLPLSISWEKAINALKEGLTKAGIKPPFNVDEFKFGEKEHFDFDEEKYLDLVKSIAHHLMKNADKRKDHIKDSRQDLEEIEHRIQYLNDLISKKRGIITGISDSLFRLQLMKQRAELKLRGLNLLETTSEEDFEKIWKTKLKRLAREGKKLEDQIHAP